MKQKISDIAKTRNLVWSLSFFKRYHNAVLTNTVIAKHPAPDTFIRDPWIPRQGSVSDVSCEALQTATAKVASLEA